MVREKNQGRSKGCTNCRQRKRKCDEKLPICSACLASNRECSGPADGMVFVNIAEKPCKPKGKPRHNGAARKMGARETPTRADEGNSHLESNAEDETVDSLIEYYVRDLMSTSLVPPKRRQSLLCPDLSCANIFTQQFVEHWMDISRCGGLSWISSLRIILPEKSFASVENSIVAASLAYYGIVTNNKAASMEARRLYGLELSRQRNRLNHLKAEGKKPTVVEVCAPLALSFFELVESTGPTGYLQHIMGAEELLAMIGPEGCTSPELFTLFRIVRGEMIYVSIRRRKPSVFAQTQWMALPFATQTRTIGDRLGDVFLLLPALLSRLDQMKSPSDDPELKADADILLSELAGMHDFFQADMKGDVDSFANSKEFKNNPILLVTKLLISILHHTAVVLVSSVSYKLNTQSLMDSVTMAARCAAILKQADEVMSMNIDGLFAGVVTSLMVVVIWSPIAEQREAARKVLQQRKDEKGIKDCLNTLIMDSIQYGEMPAHTWVEIPTLETRVPEENEFERILTGGLFKHHITELLDEVVEDSLSSTWRQAPQAMDLASFIDD